MKGLKAQMPILKIQEKTVYCACIQHSALPKSTNHLSYPSILTPASALGSAHVRNCLSTPAAKWTREILTFRSLLLQQEPQ